MRRLAELHDGTVGAWSAGPGKGARFVVRLPLAQSVAISPAAPEAARGNGARRRIVLVEDNPDIRDTFESLVTHWGHEVEMASDGPSGVELVLRARPDIALVDIGLPGMHGYDVARAIRSRTNGKLRLVAITGYGQPADRERAKEAGFDQHLLKPLAPDALLRLLAE